MKKRILSLILALSMALSVLPLGAFAADPNQDLVMQGGFPVGTSGSDWSYDDITKTLTLTSGTYDFSNTNPKTKTGKPTNQAVRCKIEIQSRAEITGGIFTGGSAGEVKNYGTISGGTFQNTCSVTNDGTIMGNGTFEGKVTSNGTIMGNGIFEGIVTNNSLISGGTFQNGCSVTNNNTISGGTFKNTCSVTNNNLISDGTFEGKVKNHDGTISSGTFKGEVTNEANRKIEGGTFEKLVTNGGTIEKGTFNGKVINNEIINNGIFNGEVSNNQGGNITNGTFEQEVINNDGGGISGGTFKGTVLNGNGIITGGTFAAGLSRNDGSVTGGIFNGDKKLTGVTGLHSITWDAASSDAKITEVNGVFAVWDPYVVIESGKTKEVTITASTKIYSLNGKRLDTNDRVNGDKKTVKFTMLDENVVLSTGELVIGSDGYPVGSNGGQDSCSGNDWEYSNYKGTLYLSAGTFDLSTTEPVKCKIQSRTTITGGTFNEAVTIIAATITKGIFNGTVYNSDGTISGGTFAGSVTNWGDITGGTFAGSVENKCYIYGGVFNRNATLTDVPDGYSITWDAASPDAKIEKVNGVPAEWDPYVVVTESTPAKTKVVTITASTDIFSLNGKPIGTDYSSSYGSDKTTVTFTMPNENVVLSGAITCTNLVMKGGYPEASNGGTTPCKGNGWTYSKKDTSNPKGKLTLTDGTYDFSYTYPQNSNGAGAEPVACAVETQLRVKITGGTFEGEVINNDLGVISGGTFHEKVSNYNGMITGGTFKSSVTSKDHGRIFGGVFNGNATLTNVTGLHSITVASGAKIKEVNGMSADWDPYVVVTENATTNEVIITADTEIFSLNGKSIGDGNCKSSYDGSDYKTVKFTMPGEPVVLNGAITCTDLVMEKGWPQASNEGKISCSGTGWSYDHSTNTLTLTSNSGTYDFSLANPQDTTKTTSADSAVACAIEIQSGVEITGGTFEKKVTNNAGGTISDGIFQDTCSVTNNGTIKNGTFKNVCSVTNNSTIENGTFKNMCSVENNGTINNGTFTYKVENNGIITGGVFNGNANLTGVTGGYNITVASNAKIEKVNGVSADWAPYVVTSNATTKEVTITASTEIFSLNGQPIVASNCNSSYGSDKTTVTFTMPDDDVVLNEEINYGDLVMEKGYPKDSNGGKTPCKGDGWQYIPNDPTYGDMLLLTGSNQTGGLFDFSTIGDDSAVECNVFVGKPTAITGGEFNGKVFNNSGILGGTFHGEVDNMGPGTIKGGTFNGAVENNGMIENGAFHDAVENNGTINDGAFNGKVENNSVINSGTFNSSVDNTTMGRIENGTFNDAVENNGTIEKGTFHGEVKNNGTIEKGTFHGAVENNGTINGGVFNGAVTGSGTVSESITGSGTLNGEPITKTEPEPEPEPTTYTVTVIGGTIDGKTSVSAKENDTLTVVLDQNDIPDGMTFDLWSISSSKLSGDINVDYRAEAMTFQMPAEDVTIRAQYRSAEIIEDAAPSPLATAATIAVGGAAAGIVVWQGVSLGVDLYLANALPQGVPVPTDRRALALLLWETAGKPEVALPTLYGDIPAEEIELQKATRWAVQNGLMDAADKKDASFFDPDHYVTKMDVFGAWLRLKKLLGTT